MEEVRGMKFRVHSSDVEYTPSTIKATLPYYTTRVEGTNIFPSCEKFTICTQTKVPKLGVMLVGWGG